MIHMSDLTEFTRVRGLIEAEIVRLSLHQPTASDLAQLKIQIETLESLAGDTELGVHRPERPRFPEKPVFMPPPVLPSLPECDRAIQMSTELASRLELLNAEITALKKANKPTKVLIRQLKQFDRSRNSILNSIRREDAPAELAKQYDEKLRERSRYFKETNNAELAWRAALQLAKQSWEKQIMRWEASRSTQANQIRRRVIHRLRTDAELLASGRLVGPAVQYVPWRLLPPPEPGSAGLERFLGHIRQTLPGHRLDESRMRFSYSLSPIRIYMGIAEFNGYCAFEFGETPNVLLECPIYGNAAYVFRCDWRTLSRLSKSELLQNHASQVGRVLHSEYRNWQIKLRRLLGIALT